MTSDSDDVADTANRKPKGSIEPPARERARESPTERQEPRVATGEQAAEANREADPPA
jgi:hypothetical protein